MIATNPLVSVITIFFNAEKFFEATIESILAQTYSGWELLLVDDGSTDTSTEIACQYARRYPDRIHYLEHETHQNCGMSASRNLGFSHAQGEYIALLDADDIWLPQKLERQVAILEAHPEAGMVYGTTWMWYGWTGAPEDARKDRGRILGVPIDTLVQPPTLLTLFLQGKAETPGTCSLLMRRAAVAAVNGFENAFRNIYEDQVFLYKMCLKTPVFVESGCWDRYRQHAGSCCHIAMTTGEYRPFSGLDSSRLKLLSWLETYLIEQEIQDAKIWQAVQKQLWPYQHPALYQVKSQILHFFLKTEKWLKSTIKQALPSVVHNWLKAHWRGQGDG